MEYEEVSELQGFKIGDIITAYSAGYHEIKQIFKRTEEEKDLIGPIPVAGYVRYQPLLRADGTKYKKIEEKGCDITFCQHALPSIDNQILHLENIRNKVLALTKCPS